MDSGGTGPPVLTLIKITLNPPRHERGHLLETRQRQLALLIHAKPLATIPDHHLAVSQA